MIKPGVYFNMSKAEYDADTDYIRSTTLKGLRVSPLVATTPRKDTKSLTLGEAAHILFLEGYDAFKERVAVRLDPADYPGCFQGMAELRDYCKMLDIKPGTSLKSAIAAIREVDTESVLFDELEADWKVKSIGKEVISADEGKYLFDLKERFAKHKHLSGLLTGGWPEVSIFWEENGLRQKCRIDYLKYDGFVELKTFSNSTERPVISLFPSIMANRQYHVSAAMYLSGIQNAKEFKANQFHDAPPDFDVKKWREPDFDIKKWRENGGEPTVIFLWLGTDVPHIRARSFQPTVNGEPSSLFEAGLRNYNEALRYYQFLHDHYGPPPWPDDEPIEPLDNRDVRDWMLE